MSDEYAKLKERIQDLRDCDFNVKRAVVPSDQWDTVKKHADKIKTDGWPEHRVNGVTVVWSRTKSEAEIEVLVNE